MTMDSRQRCSPLKLFAMCVLISFGTILLFVMEGIPMAETAARTALPSHHPVFQHMSVAAVANGSDFIHKVNSQVSKLEEQLENIQDKSRDEHLHSNTAKDSSPLVAGMTKSESNPRDPVKPANRADLPSQSLAGKEHSHTGDAGLAAKKQAVVDAFKHAWKGYKQFALGKDELLPLSRSYHEWFGLELTLIDALDTMWIMGLKEDFAEARGLVSTMKIGVDKDVNLFETTIRVLGGLLSAFHLSGDRMFLEKAEDLGDRLLGAFSTTSGIPYSDVNLMTRKAHSPKWSPDSSVSEVTSIQLEFRDLAWEVGKTDKFQTPVDTTLDKVHDQISRPDHLVPMFVNPMTGRLKTGTITLGARADSYYEYLLKLWIQSGKRENKYKEWYVTAIAGVQQSLIGHSEPNKLLFIGELLGGARFSPKMDHLVCFLPGTLALGVKNGLPESHLLLAKDLLHTCYQMYHRMPAGLSPEIAYFNTNPQASEDIIVKDADAHCLLRPETVESLFILYRVTKDKMYQDWGWEIFQNFEKHAKVDTGGYSSLASVKSDHPVKRDKMESFFLGETLKYLYLLFEEDDSVVSLDEWVFNTEAHLLPVRTQR